MKKIFAAAQFSRGQQKKITHQAEFLLSEFVRALAY